ncbi:hypothetical protein J2848_004955 [Azospirillum lipoferum]|uniref:Uncharacterized protein n=1 Tax=Azospirillum lipoferum TaxID=193 RepID=A0A5A9GL01_AZOLI|nr:MULTISPECIES: hypothetical protein [Azospirillum]KAA0594505.1 hypothetical protein FZ942_20825 [Azospirillum lipoferum]MCP1613259.1 hypothetical protein [Azospirillum lipoferum]MDW5531458.1 hypothetical protein [Azospirillum sp. NL1]
MALKQTLLKPAPPKPVLTKAEPAAQTAQPASATIFLRVDAVDVLEAFVAELDRAAARAEAAVREGRPRDALLAAGDMQTLLRTWRDRLADALAQTRSKRVAPAVRGAAKAAADQVLPTLAARMREMEAQIRVHRARQNAIGAALRAASTAPAGVYGVAHGPGARYGARVAMRTTGHAVGLTV